MSYLRLILKGASQLGEVWTTSFNFDPTAEGPGVDQTTLDAQCAAAQAVSVPATLLSMMSTALTLTGTRLEVRDDADDSLLAASETVRSPVVAGTGSPNMPAQCAVVVSLRTNTPGARGRGRVYWPACGATVPTELRMSTATTAAVVAGFKTYLTAVTTAIGGVTDPDLALNLCVRSRTSKTSPHVVQLRVGNVVDTQRRRRDRMPELLSQVSYP